MILAASYNHEDGLVFEGKHRLDFTYELKGSSITLNATEFDKDKNKTVVRIMKGTLDRAKGTLDLREDGEEDSAIFHRK